MADFQRYKFFLDGNEINQPEGWDKMEEGLSRSDELKAILVTENVPLDFIGNGYTILKDKYDTEGSFSETEIIIQESCNQDGIYETIVTGIIFTSDVEFHYKDCTAKAKIQDNSFYARINNNKSLGARLHVGRSKMDVGITAAPITQAQFFKPADGSYFSILGGSGKERSCAGYRVYDFLKFMVDFMTDGEVGFASDTFDVGGIYEGAWITCGVVIRKVKAGLSIPEFERTFPKLEFGTGIREIDRKYNIGFIIEEVAGQPVIRIEDIDFFYDTSTVMTLNNIADIVQTTDTNKLYSKVIFGSSNVLNKIGLSFPEDINFVGFKKEEYIITYKANLDKALDLSCEWISSSNVIEDVLLNSNATYDDKIFIIDTVVGSPYQCKQSNWLQATPPFYYNEFLTNYQVALRYLGGVPANISDYLNANDNTFSSRATTQNQKILLYDEITGTLNGDVSNEPVEFSAELADPSGLYDNALFEFSIPAGGFYTLYSKLICRLIRPFISGAVIPGLGGTPYNIQGNVQAAIPIRVTAYFNFYDAGGFAGGNLMNPVIFYQQEHSLAQPQFTHWADAPSTNISVQWGNPTLLPFDIENSVNIIATAGWKCVVRLRAEFVDTSGFPGGSYFVNPNLWGDGSRIVRSREVISLFKSPGSLYSCLSTTTGGGVYQTYVPDEYPVTQFSFTKGISKVQWDILKAAPNKMIGFDDGTNFFRAWVGPSIKRTRLTGNTQFKLTVNKKLL